MKPDKFCRSFWGWVLAAAIIIVAAVSASYGQTKLDPQAQLKTPAVAIATLFGHIPGSGWQFINIGPSLPLTGTSGNFTLNSSASSITFVDLTTPSGLVDGLNAAFTLPSTPNPAVSLLLFRNGVLQKSGFDYALSGASIAFLVGSVPGSGDTLLASYRK